MNVTEWPESRAGLSSTGTLTPVTANPPDVAPGAVTYRRIALAYLPLAFSWIFMALEGPVSMTLLGLTPQQKLDAASFLVLFGLAIWIESPVIDLLSTSTTWGTNRQRWEVIWRFTGLTMLFVTVVHGLVAFSPIYDLIMRGVLNVSPEVAENGRVPFQIMTCWSACVGWRRSSQGLMIRQGQPGLIGWGTLVRAATMVLVATPLITWAKLPGLVGVAWGLLASVFAEAAFIHFVSRPVRMGLPESHGEEILTLRRVFSFHAPLTASTMIMLSSPVLVTRAIAQTAEPVTQLAAWQVASSVVWLFRTLSFALPETVISLYAPGETQRRLYRFCLGIGLGLSILMAVTGFFRLESGLYTQLYNAQAELVPLAELAFAWCITMPLINSLMSYYRALLTAHHVTWARMTAIVVSVVVLFALVAWLPGTGMKGVVVAALALTLAQAVELLALWISWLRVARRQAVAA